MHLRITMMAAYVAALAPLSTPPALAQETGNVSSSYLGGLYRMDHTPTEGGVSSFSFNAPASHDSTSNLALRQAPTGGEVTGRLDNLRSPAARG